MCIYRPFIIFRYYQINQYPLHKTTSFVDDVYFPVGQGEFRTSYTIFPQYENRPKPVGVLITEASDGHWLGFNGHWLGWIWV